MNIYYFKYLDNKIKVEPMKLHHVVYVCRPLIESWQTWQYYDNFGIITLPASEMNAGNLKNELKGLVEAESFEEAKEKVRELIEACLEEEE